MADRAWLHLALLYALSPRYHRRRRGWEMLRAFLYGVGWAAISLAIQMWMWIADQTIDPGTAVIISVIAALAAVVAFQIAKRRPPNKTWSHAIYGWLWGFVTGIIAIYVTVFIHFERIQGLMSRN